MAMITDKTMTKKMKCKKISRIRIVKMTWNKVVMKRSHLTSTNHTLIYQLETMRMVVKVFPKTGSR